MHIFSTDVNAKSEIMEEQHERRLCDLNDTFVPSDGRCDRQEVIYLLNVSFQTHISSYKTFLYTFFFLVSYGTGWRLSFRASIEWQRTGRGNVFQCQRKPGRGSWMYIPGVWEASGGPRYLGGRSQGILGTWEMSGDPRYLGGFRKSQVPGKRQRIKGTWEGTSGDPRYVGGVTGSQVPRREESGDPRYLGRVRRSQVRWRHLGIQGPWDTSEDPRYLGGRSHGIPGTWEVLGGPRYLGGVRGSQVPGRHLGSHVPGRHQGIPGTRKGASSDPGTSEAT